MLLFGYFKWRPTRRRVRAAAQQLTKEFGDVAFLRASERAWMAQGDEDHRRARFWQAVSGEIARQVQRNEILRAIMRPRGALRQSADVVVLKRSRRMAPVGNPRAAG